MKRGFIGLLVAIGVLAGLAFTSVQVAIGMPGRTHKGELPPLTAVETERVERLAHDIETLAVTIGERNLANAPHALEEAEQFIAQSFGELGYEVRREPYTVEAVEVANLVAELPGSDEIVVIGAHYDSAPGTPGADDNATGVAAMLALATELRDAKPTATLRFVAFTNEEPPWFHGPEMGSRQYATAARERGDNVVAMLSLETLGYYRDEPGTQHYPSPFSLLYPDTGNFIGFIANPKSRPLVRRCVRTFREHVDFPSQGAALPASIQGIGWSDHRSFWENGYQAVMVTDTAPNRNPHYHEPTDLPVELDIQRLSRVVTGLKAVVEDLSGIEP
ncbi:MAG: M20/M25/M40 family metallo-hydrolase [Proteobacteria bacterium]|nr:M20/M25/M40 family metallo-hydrolase [Pseudomonadota bacterium]